MDILIFIFKHSINALILRDSTFLHSFPRRSKKNLDSLMMGRLRNYAYMLIWTILGIVSAHGIVFVANIFRLSLLNSDFKLN